MLYKGLLVYTMRCLEGHGVFQGQNKETQRRKDHEYE